jgi:hypothetical protein
MYPKRVLEHIASRRILSCFSKLLCVSVAMSVTIFCTREGAHAKERDRSTTYHNRSMISSSNANPRDSNVPPGDYEGSWRTMDLIKCAVLRRPLRTHRRIQATVAGYRVGSCQGVLRGRTSQHVWHQADKSFHTGHQ